MSTGKFGIKASNYISNILLFRHDESNRKCSVCKMVLRDKKNLAGHYFSKHNILDYKKYLLTGCKSWHIPNVVTVSAWYSIPLWFYSFPRWLVSIITVQRYNSKVLSDVVFGQCWSWAAKLPKKCCPHFFSCCCPTHKAKSSQRLPRVETWQVSIAASWQRDSLFDVHNHILSSHTLHCFHCLTPHPDHPWPRSDPYNFPPHLSICSLPTPNFPLRLHCAISIARILITFTSAPYSWSFHLMIITKIKFVDLQRPSLNLHRLAPTRATLSTAWRTGIQLGMLQGVENYIWDLERYLSQIWRASQNNWGRCKKIHLTFCQENVRHKLGLVVKTTFQVCLLPRLLPGWAAKDCLSLRTLVQVQA